jgi:hypothetical protein
VRTRLRTPLLALLALAALGLLAGCGNRQDVVTSAETEGPYLDVGGLQYQVQISRQLNPNDTEDSAYFIGVPDAEKLKPDETWFGVFIRVKNPTGRFEHPAREFEISDTQGKRYRPVAVGRDNIFAYRPTPISPAGVLPESDSAAAEAPIGGAMLLYRLTLDTLANRPLELKIFSGSGSPPEGKVELDV